MGVSLGRWTPREFGPCGTVLDRNVPLLFSHPERDFPYFGKVAPLIEEALLIPFYLEGEAVGTIWVVLHDDSRRFDAEDLRVLSNLGTFAEAAYQAVLTLKSKRKADREAEQTGADMQRFALSLSHQTTQSSARASTEPSPAGTREPNTSSDTPPRRSSANTLQP